MNKAVTTCAAALLLAGAAATPTAMGAAPAARPGCDREPGRTVVASARVRVVAHRRGSDTSPTYSACWRRTGRRVALGADQDEGVTSTAITHITVAGPFVGFVRAFTADGTDPGLDQPVLVDARRGRVVARPRVPEHASDGPGVTELVVTRRGTLAWIGPGAGCAGLHTADATGTTAADCGTAVDHLAVSGRHLFWLDAGAPRTVVVR